MQKKMTEAQRLVAAASLRNGRAVVDVAMDMDLSYHIVYVFGMRQGLIKPKRDNRPLDVRVWEQVEKLETGCWKWRLTHQKTFHWQSGVTPRPMGLVRHVMGLPAGKSVGAAGRSCENSWCINPEHNKALKNFERNHEIIERWRLHIQHTTSLQKLGQEFGITRQRVEQIVRKAGLDYRRGETFESRSELRKKTDKISQAKARKNWRAG